MCAMHILCKKGTVCMWVANPHFVFDRVCVRTIRTHTSRLLPEDLAIALNQVLSIFNNPLLPNILSWGDMYISSTSESTIDPSKQWVLVIGVSIVRVNNFPLLPLCTPYHGT